jgi:hypothetical protein
MQAGTASDFLDFSPKNNILDTINIKESVHMENKGRIPLLPENQPVIPVDPEKQYIVSEDYILRSIAGESVLVSLADNDYLGNSILTVNDTFAFLWELFQQPRTLAEAIALAKEEYEDPQGALEGHVRGFLWECVQLKLLVAA